DEIGAAPPLGITPEPQPEVGKPAKLSAVLKGIVTYVSSFVTSLCYSKAETNAEINKKMVEIGAGDMAKTIYDTNNSGAVDNAERLGNELPQYFQPKADGALTTVSKTVVGAINEVAVSIPNRNLLDNTDFAHPINQRNVSGTITAAGYFIDRWKLVSGNVALTANGLQLNGSMSQILEFAVGADTTARVGMYSGTANASYNNNNKTFTLTSNGGVIGWAKLEKGNAATPYVLKGYAAELSECQRYLQSLEVFISEYSPAANLTFAYSFPYGIPLKSSGIAPTVTFLQEAAFTNCTMPSYTSTLKIFAFSLKTNSNAMFGVFDLKPIISMEP
ncbi:MAG: hypothetical protein RR087_10105, partial [Oscillospiraceae bacterium]